MTEEDLTREEKIEKLEQVADEIGLDISEVPKGSLEDMSVSGTYEIKVYDENDELKDERTVSF